MLKSSTVAEYLVSLEAVSEVRAILNLLREGGVKITKSVKINQDNSGACAIATYGNMTRHSKHREVYFHFLNECSRKEIVDIVKVESQRNLADILTKAFGRCKFEFFRRALKIV